MIKDVSPVTGLENPPQPGEWTYTDYRRLTAETDTRYEVIAGVLYEMPSPSTLHQILVMKLILRLGSLIEASKQGILVPAPVEVTLPAATTVVQPDLVFVRAERRGIIKQNRIEGPPDLVVEVLSPSSIRYDRVTKFEVYETSGIQEYWILNPKTQSLEIYSLEEGMYNLHNEYNLDELVHSPLLGDLTFTTVSLFE
jgi:Uma2 family endonuclease